LLRVLGGILVSPTEKLRTASIILAEDLFPSDTVTLKKDLVLGFCTVRGGVTSHVAILARELGLPACVGMEPDILNIRDETELILDGNRGQLIVQPDQQAVANYTAEQKKLQAIFNLAFERTQKEAQTLDGHRVHIFANISNVDGAVNAARYGAEGVGLFRTELLYLEQSELPDEETQYRIYRSILEIFDRQPVILRTLDIGGDKELPYLKLSKESNPFLGLRAVRLSFARPDLFLPQLRAAIRASCAGNLRIMIPMISTLNDVKSVRTIVNDCYAKLVKEGYPVSDHIELGIMIETPSAAVISDHLAKEVDFFSIGTNDLTQYTMAADRTNPDVAPLANGYEPAVLRLIAQTVKSGHDAGIPVGVCGGLASEPLAIPFLVGLGVDELSVNSPAIPVVKQIIRTLSFKDVQSLSNELLKLSSSEEVQQLVETHVPAITENSDL
jgi:phosphoenolpyruvate-protein phosphotransferase